MMLKHTNLSCSSNMSLLLSLPSLLQLFITLKASELLVQRKYFRCATAVLRRMLDSLNHQCLLMCKKDTFFSVSKSGQNRVWCHQGDRGTRKVHPMAQIISCDIVLTIRLLNGWLNPSMFHHCDTDWRTGGSVQPPPVDSDPLRWVSSSIF